MARPLESQSNFADLAGSISLAKLLIRVDRYGGDPRQASLVSFPFSASAKSGIAKHRIIGEPPTDQKTLFLQSGLRVSPIFFRQRDSFVASGLNKFRGGQKNIDASFKTDFDQFWRGQQSHWMDIARTRAIASHPTSATKA